ncbi:MAG TPA: ECF transporter S component [Clostridia bacterium]|nr:ECF transporter S component [Clostridia bacterium]
MELGKKPAFSYHLNTRQIAVIGMLSSISIVLGITGYGFIPLPIARATIMHIPVIIGAILEGPIVGMLIGLIFGVFSIFQNLANPNLLSFAFINPLVSVLPRVLIGLTSYYCYRLVAGKAKMLGIGLGAAIGSLTNTFGVLGMIYLLYAARYAEVKGISAATSAKVIFGIALTNGLPEAMIAVIITVPVVIAVMNRK